MIFLELFFSFFKIGLFGFGGGYAMLSMIQGEIVTNHNWLSMAEFANIVAVSQVTPGPISINAATYVGYATLMNAGYSEWLSVLGSLTATLAVCLPSFLLMIVVLKVFNRYRHTNGMEGMFGVLRPTVVGLIAAAVLLMMTKENFGTPGEDGWQFGVSIFLCIATFAGIQWMKINPIRMICYCAVAGLLLFF